MNVDIHLFLGKMNSVGSKDRNTMLFYYFSDLYVRTMAAMDND